MLARGRRFGRLLVPMTGIVLLLITAAAFAASGKLTFVSAPTQGVDGVDGVASPSDVAVSADGKNVYVAGYSGASGSPGALATFKRSASSGGLTFVNANVNGSGGVENMGGPENVAVSGDGGTVYVTSHQDSVAVFERNENTGKLSFLKSVVDGQGGVTGMIQPYGIVVSPDNKNVYVSSNDDPGGLVTFKRNKTSGKLTFVAAKTTEDLGDAVGVAVSPNGKNVYVTSEQNSLIETFKRNAKSGKLRKVDKDVDLDNLNGAYEPVVSGDGRNVYVSASDGADVANFKRDKHSGKLTFANSVADNGSSLPLVDPYDQVVSDDGKYVYVAFYGGSGIDTFKRDATNGKLTFVRTIQDGSGDVAAGGLWRVAISPDNKNVYSANYDDSSVGIFERSK